MALATGFGIIALFSLITLLLADDDSRTRDRSRDDLLVWMNLARH
jgi:hypothetical protein